MNKAIKYVIFGGTGFLGRSLVDELLKDQNNFIFIVTRNKNKAKSIFSYLQNTNNLVLEQCDVNDFNQLLNLKINCDYAINFASDSTNGPNINKLQIINQMINAANNILLWSNKNVKNKYLYASSGAVYKDYEKTESNNLDIKFNDLFYAYGDTKLLCERICEANFKSNGLNYVIQRIFSVAGWHIPLNKHFAFGNFLNDSSNKKHIMLNSKGDSLRSFLDQRDYAMTTINLLNKKIKHRIYNIGSEEIISIYKLAKKFCEYKNLNIIIEDIKKNQTRQNYIPNLERIKSENLLSQSFDLTTTIQDSIKKINS